MAAPADMTTKNFTGHFIMDQTLSDPERDAILGLQDVNYLKRTAIGYGVINLYIKHTSAEENPDKFEHIDVKQRVDFQFVQQGSEENRILSYEYKTVADHVFGTVTGRSRRIKIEEIEDEYLKSKWTADTVEHGAIQSTVSKEVELTGDDEEDEVLENSVWTADQIWGFEEVEINGAKERRYTRHVHFVGPLRDDGTGKVHKQEFRIRLVYNYVGPLPSAYEAIP